MKVMSIKQNSKEWLELRKGYDTASEAPAMMSASKYMTRDQLIHKKVTGIDPYITPAQQAIFDKGHLAEEMARPIVEEMIGEELFPVVAISDNHPHLLASFDGITLLENVIFEHKLWSEGLAEWVRKKELPESYYWQLEQQMLVSGAEKVVFVTSDGTKDNFEWMEYTPVKGRAKKLLDGWVQLQKDCAAYTPSEPVVEVVANSIESLPAIAVNVTGSLAVSSNLAEFETRAMEFIGAIKTNLETDQDFADAEAMVKFCSTTEKNLDAVKQSVLGQVADIDAAMRMIDRVQDEMRTRRLSLNKQVVSQKQLVRDSIVLKSKTAFADHLEQLQKRIGMSVKMPPVVADFAGAIKGRRTIESLRSAANDELARAKIEANEVADMIDSNLSAFNELARNYKFLFSDLDQIITKSHDDMLNLVKQRIAEHKTQEERKLEAERERIRLEEQVKAESKLRSEADEQGHTGTIAKAAIESSERRKKTGFAAWWSDAGSQVRPLDNEDRYEHLERVTGMAWHAALRWLEKRRSNE